MFFEVPQATLVRLAIPTVGDDEDTKPEPTDIIGVCAGIATCFAIFILSDRELVLIHADLTTDPDTLLIELDRIRERNYKIKSVHICKNPDTFYAAIRKSVVEKPTVFATNIEMAIIKVIQSWVKKNPDQKLSLIRKDLASNDVRMDISGNIFEGPLSKQNLFMDQEVEARAGAKYLTQFLVALKEKKVPIQQFKAHVMYSEGKFERFPTISVATFGLITQYLTYHLNNSKEYPLDNTEVLKIKLPEILFKEQGLQVPQGEEVMICFIYATAQLMKHVKAHPEVLDATLTLFPANAMMNRIGMEMRIDALKQAIRDNQSKTNENTAPQPTQSNIHFSL